MKKNLLLTIFGLIGLFNLAYSQECGTAFTDPAGPTINYANNSDYTVTICPSSPGDIVTVTFTAFDTETNWDALYVFDGNSIASPQIASANAAASVPGGLAGGYWGTTIPGPFTSSSPDGCLTFRFRSDGSVNRAGWIANVTCAPPPTCVAPTNLNVGDISSSSAILAWSNPSGATSWEVLVLSAGSPAPTAASVGVTTTTNPYVVTGLSYATCYVFYVRAICSTTDNSTWAGGYNFCTQLAPPVCGGQFLDNGGSTANYGNNSDNTYTICPTNSGDVVTVTFNSFDVEATWDALYVFNGNSIASPQIASTNAAANVPGGLAGGFWGTTIPGPFTSTSVDGCLTFRFRSDNITNRAGWVANVTCAVAPTCSVPSALVATNITATSLTLNWTQSPNPDTSVATAWEILALPSGSPLPTESTTGFVSVTNTPFVVTGLTPNTCYTFYVRAVCSATDKSAWSNGVNACTTIAPPACGGQFVDNGGATANYSNLSDNTYTICPTIPGEVVTVVFNSFNTEATWDALYVFDGNSIAAPQIASANPVGNVPGALPGGFWGATIPGPFTSTSVDGCLTFRFRSDASVNNPGWVADVTCGPAPDRIVLVSFVDQNSNGVMDVGEPLFSNGSFIYQQNNDGINIDGYSPTGQFALYDTNPANSYDFSYQIQPEYASYYNPGTTTFTNISIPIGSGSQFLYFPMILTQSYNDVTISITPINAPRPGFTYQNKITYKNQGISAADGTITFVKPTSVTISTISQTGTVANATGFTYAFTNLLPNETRIFYVTMTVPDAAAINSLLTDTASISAPANDINLANNSSSNSQIVVASLDPNDKMESRGKTVPFNQFAQDDYLIYTIRFQNNGTASAIDIRIEDVLDSQIDQESIRMLSASHNYTMNRIDNQVVWNFKNIYLPQSSISDAGSKGYVQFKVKLNPGFQAGDIIPNSASIYFDTNPAIVTNTFNTKFTVPLSVSVFNTNSLVLYPNPATNSVQIGLVNTNEQITKVVFYDILGKTVKTVSTIGAENLTVDVSDLSKGAYLVEIALENNLKVTKKLIIQ